MSKQRNTHFANALQKYGFDSFTWEVLEECDSKEELDLSEIKWIKYFQSVENGFNLKDGGSHGKHSERTKQLIADTKVGEKNPAYGKPSWNSGKNLSKEHCRNLSIAHMGQQAWNKGLPKEEQPQYGKPKSDDTKQKIGLKNKGEGNGQSKLNWEIVTKIREEYSLGNFTQKELAKKYNISKTQIYMIVSNRQWRI